LATERLKGESDRGVKDKKKKKEEKLPLTSNQPLLEEKIHEMSKIIKIFTSKLAKLEMEEKNVIRPIQDGGNRNQNQ
jgi:hypothetical protein